MAAKTEQEQEAQCPGRGTVGFTPPPAVLVLLGDLYKLVHVGMHYLRGFCNLKWFNYLLSSSSKCLDTKHDTLCTHSAEYVAKRVVGILITANMSGGVFHIFHFSVYVFCLVHAGHWNAKVFFHLGTKKKYTM